MKSIYLAIGIIAGLTGFCKSQARVVDMGMNTGKDCVVRHVASQWRYIDLELITLAPFHIGLSFAAAPVGERASIYAGLGLGYYNYYVQYRYTEYREEQVEETYQSNTTGWAQTFLAGVQVSITDWIGFNLEAEKLGFHNLVYVGDVFDAVGDKIGEYEKGYDPLPGVGDMGISVALVFSL